MRVLFHTDSSIPILHPSTQSATPIEPVITVLLLMTLLATASGEFNLVFPSYIKLSLSRHSYPTVLFYFLPSNENLTCSGVIDGEPIRNLLTYLCLSCIISKIIFILPPSS